MVRVMAGSTMRSASGGELLPKLDEQGRKQEAEITAPFTAAERRTVLRDLQRMSASAGLIPGVHPKLG